MCGIAGLFRVSEFNRTTDQVFSPELLSKMRDCMAHRGPDDSGLFISPGKSVGLAHRRLSIIDLTSAAAQPMCNEFESIWIVFNGEIYNHAELRKELQSLGRKFKTDHSDTEVIIKGYEQWGTKVIERLRGMFSFAIWDKNRKRLWLARDRMGVKPLYYTEVNGVFGFASEIKSLLEIPGVKRECHERALYDFLTFLVSPAPQTLFRDIFKLPAGHTLMVEESGAQVLERYWNPFTGVGKIENRSEKEWTQMILKSLRESIRYRMVSDVKFGVFLSGGIDSSANVALMAEQMADPVETFSIGFDGVAAELSELKYARLISQRYKTNPHEFIVKKEDFLRLLPEIIHHQDEPVVDPACVPLYYGAQLAKKSGTTVCQVGEGADELFCGYVQWGDLLKFQSRMRFIRFVPGFIRAAIWGLIRQCSSGNLSKLGPLDRLRRVLMREPVFWGGTEGFTELHKDRLLSAAFKKRMKGYSSYNIISGFESDFKKDAPKGADELHWMTYLDFRLRLPELLLMRVDKMTMASGVEARVPFLDQEFIKLAMSIPKDVKYKNERLKHLLKEAVESILPHEVIHRNKQGFGLPMDQWFNESLLAWASEKIMDFSRRTPFFDVKAMDEFLAMKDSMRTWFLLSFVLWHEKWIENKDLALPIN